MDGPLKLDLGEILQGNAQLDLRLENGTEPLFKIERKGKLQKLGSIDDVRCSVVVVTTVDLVAVV